MIKKITLLIITLISIYVTATANFTIGITGPATSYEGFESPLKTRYTVTYTGTLPRRYDFKVAVVNGTATAYNLIPLFTDGGTTVGLYVQVKWNCGVTSGSITITEAGTGVSTTFNVFIKSFFNMPASDYCSEAVVPKQNLLLGQIPSKLSVFFCIQPCLDERNTTYQWQVGDVPIGVFPQLPPNGFEDIRFRDIPPGADVGQSPTYQPPSYTTECIKAYRRKIIFLYQGVVYVFYSTPAVISTFDNLTAGTINGGTTFNNGVPLISQTPATGGLCDGFNYVYTWEQSVDGNNWVAKGTGASYPANAQISGSCYIRRRVDCDVETLYSNTLNITPAPLNPGTITGGATVAFNTIPVVTQTLASGSACNPSDYIYTWERSINNGAWLAFGTAGINYPVNTGIIGTCKIRRKVHCVYEDAYSNEISFTIIYTSPNAENYNYVRTNDIVIPSVQSWEQADALVQTGDKLQSTTYLDGFGRAIQSVTKQGSLKQTATGLDPNDLNNYQDIVSYMEYDGLGRADKGFLPYATTTNLGFYKTNAAAEQQSFTNQKYGEPANSIYTYSQSTYDGSPLNRVTNVKLPGAAWNNDANYKGISSDYDFNKQTENVRIWDIGFTPGDKPTTSGVYADNLLTKSITKDEKDKLIVTYTDLSGNTILKRVQEAVTVSDNSYTGWLNTYYVYDDFGRSRYTITPKAVALMAAAPGGSWIIDDDIKKGLCFYQEYDKRGRVNVKHSPDGGEVWLVYDNQDRLVLSQDENQRNRINLNPAKANQWSFSLYDENDRVLTTGLINDGRDKNAMQLFVDGLTPQNQSVQIYTGVYETITAYNPVTISTSATDIFINSINYYDDYSKQPLSHKPVNLAINDFAPVSNSYIETPSISYARIRGAATVSKIRVLTASYENESSTATQFLTSTTFYDEKGRVAQSYADNIKGGVDASAVLYDFAGKVLCTRGKHNMPGNSFDGLLVVTKNDYDLLGRGTKLWKLYTKNAADIANTSIYKKLSEVKLDEFGRGRTKTIGDDPLNPGNPLETMDYSYNIQGWLTGVNKDYALATPAMAGQFNRRFGFYLGYENGDANFVDKQYNGSITGVIWRSQGDNMQRKYNYEYDNINRFKAANFTQKDNGTWGITQVDLSASVSAYDANGNIQGMLQTGIVPGTNGGVLIDNLQYQYYNKSNKLTAVNDFAAEATNGKQGDFKNNNPSNGLDYDYDFNGNLKNDRNKNLQDAATGAGIISNFLDLPQTITIKDKSKTEYTYDAAGSKLAKKVTQLIPNAPAPVTTWYIQGFVYEEITPLPPAPPVKKTELRYILNEEGKLRITDVTAYTTPNGVIQSAITGNIDFGLGSTQWGVWDYYLKDNLSNTRMVLTEEGQMQIMKCTMEGVAAPGTPTPLQTEEQDNFGNTYPNNEVSNTRTPGPVPGWTSNLTQAAKLQPPAGVGTAIGPNVILKVMAGDIINAQADYYYQANTPQPPNNNVLTNIVQSLLGALSGNTNVSGGVKSGIDQNYLQNNPNSPLPPFLNNYQPPTNDNRPRAYLNYIFFDEQFRFVNEKSGADMVKAAGDGQTPLRIPISTAAPKNGYVYVYLSNETPNMPVYFDNFFVTHTRGPIVEDNAYYPFGLKIQGISAKAAGKAKAKQSYQGDYNEQDDETSYNEFALRFYDPQIGRWLQVDPKIIQSGMYNGMGNDPVNQVDPDGGGPDIFIKNKKTKLIKFDANVTGNGDVPDGWEAVEYGYKFTEDGTGARWMAGRDGHFHLLSKTKITITSPIQSIAPIENLPVDNTNNGSLADAGFGWANYDREVAHEWTNQQADYNQLRSRGATIVEAGINLPKDRIGKFEHYWQNEQDYRRLSLIFVGAIAAPIAITELGVGAGVSTLVERYGADFTYRTFSKVVENGGDWSKVDYFDVGLSTFNPFRKIPGGNYLTEGVNSLIDFKDGKIMAIFAGKSTKDILIDASVGVLKANVKDKLQLNSGGNNLMNSGQNNLMNSGVDLIGAGGKIILKNIFE
jgi:RHS repeat-associated protein